MNNVTLNFIQEQIGYVFKNSDLLQQAFIRCSYSKEHGGEDNEVLEFIGDKVLDFVVVKILTEKYGSVAKENHDCNLYEKRNVFFSEYREGKLTEIKKKLVCREMLSSRIRMFGFHNQLIMGKSDVDQNIQENASVQEDLFEAIIGAVALDSKWNLNTLTSVVNVMLAPDFYLENGFDDTINYVELLQQWYQKKHNKIPSYQFLGRYARFLGNENITCALRLELGNSRSYDFEESKNTKIEARMAVAEKAYKYLEKNGLLFSLVDEIGKPEIDKAINQLQELFQKGYIKKPEYDFSETHDADGNPIWSCNCNIYGRFGFGGEFSSKNYGKKVVAYKMLCDILGWGEENET